MKGLVILHFIGELILIHEFLNYPTHIGSTFWTFLILWESRMGSPCLYFWKNSYLQRGKSKNKLIQSCFEKLTVMYGTSLDIRPKDAKKRLITLHFDFLKIQKSNTYNFLKSYGFVFWPIPFQAWKNYIFKKFYSVVSISQNFALFFFKNRNFKYS